MFYFDDQTLGIFYTVCSIPVGVMFVIYGGRIARILTSQNIHLDEKEQMKRLYFAQRVRYSGITMLLWVVSGALWSVFTKASVYADMWLFNLVLHVGNFMGHFEVISIRSPEKVASTDG